MRIIIYLHYQSMTVEISIISLIVIPRNQNILLTELCVVMMISLS